MHPGLTALSLPPPSKLRLRTLSPSRSRSASPKRHERSPSRHFDSLYRNLSPTRTLRAIIESSCPTSDRPQDQNKLVESIRTASDSQKSFARKVAESSKLLKDWCHELHNWPWYGRFDEPDEQGKAEQAYYELKSQDANNGSDSHVKDLGYYEQRVDGYWGSLPATRVLAYEERLEDIADDLEALDIEDQKSHVLNTHVQAQPTTPKSDSSFASSTSEYVHLDALTALTTATILQALPYYSRLINLMNAWSSRILVLRHAPHFLKELEDTREALDSAWVTFGTDLNNPAELLRTTTAATLRHSFEATKADLEAKVSELGRQVDFMLDALEGREETLPEEWVSGVDGCETDYSSWAVEAQKLILLHEHQFVPEKDLGPQVVEIREFDQRNSDASIVAMSAPAAEVKSYETPLLDQKNTEQITSPVVNTVINAKTDLSTMMQTSNPSEQQHPSTTAETITAAQSRQDDTHSRFSSQILVAESEMTNISRTAAEHEAADTVEPLVEQETTTLNKVPAELPVPSHPALPEPGVSDEVDDGSPSLATENETGTSENETNCTNSATTVCEVAEPLLEQFFPVSNNAPQALAPMDESIESQPVIGLDEDDMPDNSVASSQNELVLPLHTPRTEPIDHDTSSIDSTTEYLAQNSPPPLNATMMKRQASNHSLRSSTSDASESSSAVFVLPESETNSHADILPNSNEDRKIEEQLDRQISSILKTVPAKINFTQSNNVGTDSRQSGADLKPRPNAAQRSLSAGNTSTAAREHDREPVLTLAPALTKGRTPRNSSSSDIKLYHLTQPGRDKPIKLFIRLVGDGGERVMVRVGGGWADLGQYLREYVSHHGRVASADPQRAISPIPMMLRSHSRQTSIQSASGSRAADLPNDGSVSFLDSPTANNIDGVAATPISNRPASRHTSRLSISGTEDESLGLAGPSSKKSGMSADKERWVEEMLDRAKRVSSGETRKSKRTPSGDFAESRKGVQMRRVVSRTSTGEPG